MNGLGLALAPLVIVGLWALLVPLAGVAARGWSRVVALCGVGLALAAAASLVGEPGLALGGSVVGEALVVDRLGLGFDLVVLVALAVLIAGEPPGPGAAARHGLVLLAGTGALLCAHAGDLSVLVTGLELACLAAGALLWLGREASGEAAGRAGFTWLMGQGLAAGLLWLGLGLIYGATGTTRLAELGGRIGAVFLRWGASTVQAAVDLLHSSEPLGASLISYSRDAAVHGAAPAMLLLPGLGLALVGLLARLGAVPLQLLAPAAVQRGSRRLQLVSACAMAFSHGSNDAQKAMGIITLALVAYIAAGHAAMPAWMLPQGKDVPQWVILACAAAIGLGTMAGGKRIIKTMGAKIIRITPLQGFAAETAGTATILTASAFGVPVSTTSPPWPRVPT